ncbi:unnamed protein product [Owenia fusiformis]|uniref:L-Fucosyltransferase n=1 Tax=Owenia fusiformis TaxID=6347 RepID=A0A8J1TH32_OWEFU|nr:unnamed protein product [Owenia fusiformis]
MRVTLQDTQRSLLMVMGVLVIFIFAFDQYLERDTKLKIASYETRWRSRGLQSLTNNTKDPLGDSKLWMAISRKSNARSFGYDTMVYKSRFDEPDARPSAISSLETYHMQGERKNSEPIVEANDEADTVDFKEMMTESVKTIANTPTQYIPRIKSWEDISNNPRKILLFPGNGRLGDEMFQYSSAWAIAKKTNRTLYIPSNSRLLEIFSNIKAEIFDLRSLPKDINLPVRSGRGPFKKDLFNVKAASFVLYNGLGSFSYITNIKDEIKNQYTFNSDIKSKVDNFFKTLPSAIKNEKTINVGVHVRRGDLLSLENNRKGYRVPSVDYFLKTMQHYDRILSPTNIRYIICSDDPKWAREHLNFPSTHFCPGESDSMDLAILARCDHSIMSVGSFGAWGSYLSGGMVTFYPYPYSENSVMWKLWHKHKHEKVPAHGLPYYS